MEHAGTPAYGLWGLVIINSIIFIAFAFSFFKPQTKTDWRSFGAFSAFIVALFVEMYGFPLTIYLVSGWLAQKYPQLDPYSHESGHLFHTLLGIKGNPHFDPLHILSNILIVAGFTLAPIIAGLLYNLWPALPLVVAVALSVPLIGFLLQAKLTPQAEPGVTPVTS